MIPVPMMGFKSLNQRLQLQNQMTEGHQNRNDIIQKEIRKLQVRHGMLDPDHLDVHTFSACSP